MTNEEFSRTVEAAVSEVLENMYFMFPEWPKDGTDRPEVPQSCFSASVGINGGDELLTLYASSDLVSNMAESFLGMSHGLEDADLADIFKEACNVMAGNIVTRMNLDTNIGLGTPVAERMSDCTVVEKNEGSVLSIDGEFMKVVVNREQLPGFG